MPVKKRPSTKPPARGLGSYGRNEGNDRPLIINGGRRPSSSICPSKHEICMQLTTEPFAPDWTINWRLFWGKFLSKPEGIHCLLIWSCTWSVLPFIFKSNSFISLSSLLWWAAWNRSINTSLNKRKERDYIWHYICQVRLTILSSMTSLFKLMFKQHEDCMVYKVYDT